MLSRTFGMDLQALRQHRHAIARFVLACYVLVTALAMASSLARPDPMQVVCTGTGGMMVMGLDDHPSGPRGGHVQDCPLCAPAVLPLLPSVARVEPCAPLALALRSVAAAWIAWVTAPPLPSRGPPASSV